MNQLYKTVDISKQAVYQYHKRQKVFDKKTFNLIVEADQLRKEHPGCGVEKMYRTLSPDFIGRDRFVNLFMNLGYRIKRNKNYRRTTFSTNLYYPNLIKGSVINAPNEIWQSDITYIEVGKRFYYVVFIIDVYTKKIVGFNVSDSLRAEANVKALKMALRTNKAPRIHHSDRGSQYIYKPYIELLKSNNSLISMGLIAQDNAYAERINRTIKEEYIDYWKPKDYQQLKRYISKAVNNYNSKRGHQNINNMAPIEFENYWKNLNENNKPKITIFDDELLIKSGQH